MEQRPAAVAALDGAQVVGDLGLDRAERRRVDLAQEMLQEDVFRRDGGVGFQLEQPVAVGALLGFQGRAHLADQRVDGVEVGKRSGNRGGRRVPVSGYGRSEEHTSELQSLMRISYAVFCLKKKK